MSLDDYSPSKADVGTALGYTADDHGNSTALDAAMSNHENSRFCHNLEEEFLDENQETLRYGSKKIQNDIDVVKVASFHYHQQLVYRQTHNTIVTDLTTDHPRQTFGLMKNLIPYQPSSPEYEYPGHFHVLTPLLDEHLSL